MSRPMREAKLIALEASKLAAKNRADDAGAESEEDEDFDAAQGSGSDASDDEDEGAEGGGGGGGSGGGAGGGFFNEPWSFLRRGVGERLAAATNVSGHVCAGGRGGFGC